MTDNKSTDSRRKLLKSIAVGSGAVVAGKSMPESWAKPIVNSVMLPVHAETTDSDGSLPIEVCTDLLRIEIQDGYNGAGTNPVLNDSDKPLTVQIATGPALTSCDEPHYITAWGYYKDAPNTPVYINTEVLWTTQDSNIAFLGTLPGIFPQNNSFVSGNNPGETILNATIFDFCAGIAGIRENAVTARVKVIVDPCSK